MKNTLKNLSAVVGQSLAKAQLETHVLSCGIMGGPIKLNQPTLIYGPAGTGKDHFIMQLEKDFAEREIEFFHFMDCDSILLQANDDTQTLVNALNLSQSGPVVVVLNEAQKIFKGSKTKAAMERDLCKFIFPHGAGMQQTIIGEIAKKEVSANFANLLLILATNEKDSLETAESRRRDQSPFARRFVQVELSNYSQAEMEEIIPAYFATRGLTIKTCASGLVRRLHRGNMEALSEVFAWLSKVIPEGKSTVNMEEVLSACKLTTFLPRGLRKSEARLLSALRQHGTLSKARAEQISGIYGKKFNATLNHLCSQVTESKGETVPFPLVCDNGKVHRTDCGDKYLASIERDGFLYA